MPVLHSPWNTGRGTQLARAISHSRVSLCSQIYSRETYFSLNDNREERLNCFRPCKKIYRFYPLGCLFLFSAGYQKEMVVSVGWWPFSNLYELNLVASDECIEMDVPHKVCRHCFSEADPEGTKNSSNLCKYAQGCLQVWGSEGSTICLAACEYLFYAEVAT